MNCGCDTTEVCDKCKPKESRPLNESAIRAHALACSRDYRAGKFTRVGQDFMDEVHASVEALVRNIVNKDLTLHSVVPRDGDFVTGELLEKVKHAMNDLIGRMIQNKVQRQPTVGVTLSRTR